MYESFSSKIKPEGGAWWSQLCAGDLNLPNTMFHCGFETLRYHSVSCSSPYIQPFFNCHKYITLHQYICLPFFKSTTENKNKKGISSPTSSVGLVSPLSCGLETAPHPSDSYNKKKTCETGKSETKIEHKNIVKR